LSLKALIQVTNFDEILRRVFLRNKNEIKKAIKDPNFNWLGRKPFIGDFIKHLQNQTRSVHICINGVWGSGKTTTIMGIMDRLDKIDEGTKPLVLYLDAWKYEHYQDPLFALLKVMQKELPEIFKIIMSDIQKNGIEPQVGLNLPFLNIAMSKNRDDTYNRLLNESEYIDALNEIMITAVKKFKEERSNELIIFIDELDRAKPDFALRTMEMFHHLQDELPTHIVYSVDMTQLSSIVKHYYGYEYNVEIFTHKVFDEIVSLKKLTKNEIESYIDEKLISFSIGYSIPNIRNLIMKYMGLDQLESLRTLNRICKSITQKLQTGYFKRTNRGFIMNRYYLGNDSNLWGYVEFLVILEVFSLTDPMKVYEFLRGENIIELLNFILEKEQGNSNEELGSLIEKSYNGDKNNETNLSYSDLNNEEKIIGIKRLFAPITEDFESTSVFSSGELF